MRTMKNKPVYRERDKSGIIKDLEARYDAIERRQKRLKAKMDEVIDTINRCKLPEVYE